jgi:hypothetical protein
MIMIYVPVQILVSDCCLMPLNSAFFSAISWWEQVNYQWYDDEVRFVLDQHAELDLYSASSLKQQSADRHVAPLGVSEVSILHMLWKWTGMFTNYQNRHHIL